LPYWDSFVVLCAANSYDEIKVADHHMAEQLSMLTPVLYVDPPLSQLTQFRNPRVAASLNGPRLRMLTPRLARLTPVVQPYPSRPGMTRITSALSRRHLRNAASRLGARVSAVVSAWPQYPVFGSCNEQVRVYWAQDDFVGGAALLGLNAVRLERHERQIAAAADVVVAANPVVAESWRKHGRDTTLIPYGADVDAYASVERAPLPPDVQLEAPIAGFVGQLNERIDLRLLEAVAESGRSLLLIGPVSPSFTSRRFDALRDRSNVCWVGPKPFGALPGYLRLIDVGLVPYRDSPFNRGSFPLKTLEYLAAGRAVVATGLPAIRWLATELVAVASEPRAFADLVDRELDQVRTPAVFARRQAFAAAHSWARRAAELHGLIVTTCGRADDGDGAVA
jgi:teichuronic acid biosynthesis glycosyltransferase TuaH